MPARCRTREAMLGRELIPRFERQPHVDLQQSSFVTVDLDRKCRRNLFALCAVKAQQPVANVLRSLDCSLHVDRASCGCNQRKHLVACGDDLFDAIDEWPCCIEWLEKWAQSLALALGNLGVHRLDVLETLKNRSQRNVCAFGNCTRTWLADAFEQELVQRVDNCRARSFAARVASVKPYGR